MGHYIGISMDIFEGVLVLSVNRFIKPTNELLANGDYYY